MVDRLDFSTGHSRAVFYSGPGNRAKALSYSSRTGRTPIDFTSGGKHLESLGPYKRLTQSQADAIWAEASRRFAHGARGEVTLFVKGASPTRVFRTVEMPILEKSGQIHKWIYRNM